MKKKERYYSKLDKMEIIIKMEIKRLSSKASIFKMHLENST